MIRLGVCRPLQDIQAVASIGYDYLETPLSPLAMMDDADFREASRQAARADIGVEVFNVLMPASLSIVGPHAMSGAEIDAYLNKAFQCAAALSGRLIIFGSGRSRRRPDGFPEDTAREQLDDFLRRAHDISGRYGITIAIEPLNQSECNQINQVRQVIAIVRRLALSNITVMGDLYHMMLESEPMEALSEAGGLLTHVHTAALTGRAYPHPDDGVDYGALFGLLSAMSYQGRISVEGTTSNFMEDATTALSVLKAARDG